MSIPNVTVTIESTKSSYLRTIVTPIPGQRFTQEISLTDGEKSLLSRAVELQKLQIPLDKGEVSTLGLLLFKILFSDTAAQIYDSMQKPWRLYIDSQAFWIVTLPWELLREPSIKGGSFIVWEGGVSVIRYLPAITPQPLKVIDGPVHLLYIAASPRELPTLKLGYHYERFLQTSRAIAADNLIVDNLIHATPNALADKLKTNHYHILHFDGYGVFGREGEACLALEDTDGSTAAFSGLHLRAAYGDRPPLLTVLSNCRSPFGVESQPLGGIAEQVVAEARMPLAVTMQFPMPDQVVEHFTETFYHTLFAGHKLDIDQAILTGRKAITPNNPEQNLFWAGPILLVQQSEDLPVWKPIDNKSVPKSPPGFEPLKITLNSLEIILGQDEKGWFLHIFNKSIEDIRALQLQLKPSSTLVVTNPTLKVPRLSKETDIELRSFTLRFNPLQSWRLEVQMTWHRVQSHQNDRATALFEFSPGVFKP